MIKYLTVAFLFCLSSTIVNAQKNYEQDQQQSQIRRIMMPVVCAPIETVFGELSAAEIQELPIWVGRDNEKSSQWTLMMNRKTNTFTIVQFSNSTACVIGMGDNSKILIKTD